MSGSPHLTQPILKGAAAVVAGLAIIIAIAGLVYGMQGVRVAAGTASCGDGFSYRESADLTDSGSETCAQAQSARQATTWGLVGGGIGGLVTAAILVAITVGTPIQTRAPVDA